MGKYSLTNARTYIHTYICMKNAWQDVKCDSRLQHFAAKTPLFGATQRQRSISINEWLNFEVFILLFVLENDMKSFISVLERYENK